jgi:hypothetical protein
MMLNPIQERSGVDQRMMPFWLRMHSLVRAAVTAVQRLQICTQDTPWLNHRQHQAAFQWPAAGFWRALEPQLQDGRWATGLGRFGLP